MYHIHTGISYSLCDIHTMGLLQHSTIPVAFSSLLAVYVHVTFGYIIPLHCTDTVLYTFYIWYDHCLHMLSIYVYIQGI